MVTAVVITFCIGYLVIVLENLFSLDKTVPALLMGAFCWMFIALGHEPVLNDLGQASELEPVLLHHLGGVAEILIFLIGAMTIVELIDLHQGFALIANYITTQHKRKMIWIVGIAAFLLSAVLDNLTTTIVLISLLRRLVPDAKERLVMVGVVVLGANAGGAWSPIGDITTTMLWVDHKVSSVGLISRLILPSILNLTIPLAILSFMPSTKGMINSASATDNPSTNDEIPAGRNVMLILGLSSLLFVPIFKSITHLPPYVGMMISLAVTWGVSEYLHPSEDFDRRKLYSAKNALTRIEMSSILFFLGILLGVSALEALGLLSNLAQQMDTALPNHFAVGSILGVASAVIDNVPLVAASIGMYKLPMDDYFWHLIAYTAGTGGSMLIVGSAAGVAAMGIEKISFGWYLKHISWIALLGYLGGLLCFLF